MTTSQHDFTLIGYCRFCRAPILHGKGATCGHKGYLIYGPYKIFYQAHDGYEYHASMSPLGPFSRELSTPGDASDVIQDILLALDSPQEAAPCCS